MNLSRERTWFQLFLATTMLFVIILVVMYYKLKPVEVEKVVDPYVISYEDEFEFKRNSCTMNFECIKMAEALVYEARSEGRTGMIDVANVIKNRVLANRWGSTVYDVVHDYKQFSYLRDMYRQTRPTQYDWDLALEVSYDVMAGIIQDTTKGAVFYRTTKFKRLSSKHYKLLFVRGNHVFYK